MYLVVSRWEAMPGQQEAFEQSGPPVTSVLRQQPGVEFVESFASDGQYITVHGYRDEAAYRAVVDDPDGAFARIAAQYRIEETGRWLSSERGETIPHVGGTS